MTRFLSWTVLLGALVAATSSVTLGQNLPLTTTATGVMLHAAPATVTLAPLPAFAPALAIAQADKVPIVLAIEGVAGQPVQPVRINVFVGKPDADANTSTDDPHFVGYIAIAPKYGADKSSGREIGRSFDVSNLDLSAQTKGLLVTLVPVTGIAEAPGGLSLSVRQISIRRSE